MMQQNFFPSVGLFFKVSDSADSRLILAIAWLRACAIGISGVLFALYLVELHFSVQLIGVAISAGLAGCACGTLVVTYTADRLGRRATLLAQSLLMGAGGLCLSFSSDSILIWLGIFLGMVNSMGRDRGMGVTVEQPMLAGRLEEGARTTRFAWYNVSVDAGHAVGALLGGLPVWIRLYRGASSLQSYQWTWIFYSVLCFSFGGLVLCLSSSVEPHGVTPTVAPLSKSSRSRVTAFALLSGLDSLGGGFLTNALISYWFFTRFGMNEASLGMLFLCAHLLNSGSYLGAAWLSKRIGLVPTMVFTHLPSSLLLMAIPFVPNLYWAVGLFLVREFLVEMDVPTRQSYLFAIVKVDERTRASGMTNLTRGLAWTMGPLIAGFLMPAWSPSAPLLVGPGIKIIYDLLLWRLFRGIKDHPPAPENPLS
jgi:MFS family permease